MPTPQTPFQVSGVITKSNSLVSPSSVIVFTLTAGQDQATANSKGRYLIDLANVGYTAGETVSYSARDVNANEVFNGTFTLENDSKELNVALSERTGAVSVPSNRATQVYTIGGVAVSEDNPLPVAVINSADVIDLINNPDYAYTYDGNGRAISETVTIRGVSYKRIFGYSGTDLQPVTKSKWVQQ